MSRSKVSQDSSVARTGSTRGDEVSVPVREVAVGGSLRIVVTAKVVSQLVSEAEVAEGAGLLSHGHRVAAGVGGQVSHAAAVEVSC